jgi:GDPmannose 4,6-dehydratase
MNVIISGCTGQCGSYFAEYLLQNTDYDIYGMVRRLSVSNHKNIDHIKDNPRFHIFSGDLNDSHSIFKNIEEIQPDYFINCAAQSFVFESWISPANTFEVDAVAIIHILEAIRKIKPSCRFVNFGSSEEMGDVIYSPQDENHPARARSVYGAAKIAARQIIKVYRESYNLYAVQPWNYNYESCRRGEEFVTRKITKNVARIYHAIKNGIPFESCKIGNLNSKRDWSHAKDIVEGVWRLINQEKYNKEIINKIPYYIENPYGAEAYLTINEQTKKLSKYIKEYIFSSGTCHSIREFIEKSFKYAGFEAHWEGRLLNEKYVLDNYINDIGSVKSQILVEIDPKFFRPADVEILCGSSDLAKKDLQWKPQITFDDLVKEMTEYDINDL